MSDSSNVPKTSGSGVCAAIQTTNVNVNDIPEEQKKYLLLVDMNGTLCHRSGSGNVVGRPGHYDFIANMSENNKFDFCMYTSMLFKNADQVVRKLASRYQYGIEIFDKSYNKCDPNPEKENDWDTIRDLPKVWARKPGYCKKNTILVDCEFRKLREAETPDNGILVPEFTSHENPDWNVLERLEKYLTELGTAQPEDVTKYMRTHPFRTQKESDGSAPRSACASACPELRSAPAASVLTLRAAQAPILAEAASEITAITHESDYACHPPVKKRAVAEEVCSWTVDTVPEGTMVEFMHIEGLKFTMRHLGEKFKISFTAHRNLGILKRIMDYHDVLSAVGETRITFECVEKLD